MKVIQEDGVLKITGSIHTNALGPLREALLDALVTQPELVVDLSRVDMCDTATLQVLAAFKRSASSFGAKCRIEVSMEVRETLAAIGFPLEFAAPEATRGS